MPADDEDSNAQPPIADVDSEMPAIWRCAPSVPPSESIAPPVLPAALAEGETITTGPEVQTAAHEAERQGDQTQQHEEPTKTRPKGNLSPETMAGIRISLDDYCNALNINNKGGLGQLRRPAPLPAARNFRHPSMSNDEARDIRLDNLEEEAGQFRRLMEDGIHLLKEEVHYELAFTHRRMDRIEHIFRNEMKDLKDMVKGLTDQTLALSKRMEEGRCKCRDSQVTSTVAGGCDDVNGSENK